MIAWANLMIGPRERGLPGLARLHLPELTIHEKLKPTWQIVIGGKSPTQLLPKLSAGRLKVGPTAQTMLLDSNFRTLEQETRIDLARVTVAYLGFQSFATISQICEEANRRELDRVPAEVGPHLRLAYPEQPSDEILTIGMDPITDSHGDQDVFQLVNNDEGLWLSSRWAEPGGLWSPDNEFVFSLRK